MACTDYTIICRLCLAEHQNIWEKQINNIFDHSLPDLSIKIQRCTSVMVAINDGLPASVCTNCIQMVIQFDVFREMCQYSDNVLRNKFYCNISNENSIQAIKNQESESSGQETKILENDDREKSKIYMNIGDNQHLNFNNHVFDFNNKENDVIRSDKKSQTNNSATLIGNDCNTLRSNMIQCNRNNLKNETNLDHSNREFYKSESNNSSSPHALHRNLQKRKKMHKMKKQKSDNHSLFYINYDFAVLNGTHKVRIYRMDESIREIIGDNIYPCEMCAEQFTSFFEYHDHQEIHNGQFIFKCDKCEEVFCERKQLVEHDSRHKIACEVCKLEVLPKSLSAHLLLHTDVHKCSQCGMRHTSNASLEKHIKARHTGIKGFVCHVCGKQSSCQSSMNRHMAYHSNERPYKCQYCDFSAKSLNIVQVHTSRRHFAEKCVCEICAKIFKSQPSLIQHMKRIHTARKHICDICGKAFIERYNLTRHLKRHAGQRLHECKICHIEFFTVRKLKEHMHSHRQGCVNCPKCGKEFFYKKYYTKHVLKCSIKDEINHLTVTYNSLCHNEF